jgi:MoxR-like ATPase
MAERQVTIGDTTYPLERPFLVLATQNPLEQEGTYPLPEAQMDRFMFKLIVTYPKKDEEMQILNQNVHGHIAGNANSHHPRRTVEGERAQRSSLCRRKNQSYIIEIVMTTRQPEKYGMANLQTLLKWEAVRAPRSV